MAKNISVFSSVKEAVNQLSKKPNVAIITTVSSLKRTPQIEDVAKFGMPVISTCEELSYPWQLQPELTHIIHSTNKSTNWYL